MLLQWHKIEVILNSNMFKASITIIMHYNYELYKVTAPEDNDTKYFEQM